MGKTLVIKGADFSANGIKETPVGTYTTSAEVNLAFRRIFIDASGFTGEGDFWENYYIGVWCVASNIVGVRMRKASDNTLTDIMLWSNNQSQISSGIVSGTVAGVYFYYEVDLNHPIFLEDSAARAVTLTEDATNPEYDPRND